VPRLFQSSRGIRARRCPIASVAGEAVTLLPVGFIAPLKTAGIFVP